MKKRWLLNLVMLCLVAGLVTFLYMRPKTNENQDEMYEISSFKLVDFHAITVEHPTKTAVKFEKINGFWRLTAPQQTRADLASVQRILAIVAAKSKEKVTVTGSTDLEKFGLNNAELRLKLYKANNEAEEFVFGTHNPITDEQYVLYKNSVYLIGNIYSEAAATEVIELVDKSPLKPTEKVTGFDFSHLEQWVSAKLNVDIVEGQWRVSIPTAKPQQNELNEWMDFSWIHNPARSVEFYKPDRKTYPSFEVKLADGSKIHFDKIQESPDLLLARPDEGLIYAFPSDAGFTMLNPPLNIPSN